MKFVSPIQINKRIPTLRSMQGPSFLKGMARVVDLFGTLDTYQPAKSGNETDFAAIKSDWEAVGRDLASAMSLYGTNIPKKRK